MNNKPISKKYYFLTTSIIFFLVGFIHLLKLTIGFEISIFNHPYPIFISFVEMIIAFILSYKGFQFGRK